MILFNILDLLLIFIMLFDTLGLIYQFRTNAEVKPKDYIRVYSSWILFLILYNLFSCSWKGFFGLLIQLILFAAKVYVTIPKFKGSLKIHKHLIEDEKGKEYFNKVYGLICSKLEKFCPCDKEVQKIDENECDTIEPERTPENNDMSNE